MLEFGFSLFTAKMVLKVGFVSPGLRARRYSSFMVSVRRPPFGIGSYSHSRRARVAARSNYVETEPFPSPHRR